MRDCPLIVVLNAPFRPMVPPYVFACVTFASFVFVLTFLVVTSPINEMHVPGVVFVFKISYKIFYNRLFQGD